MNLFVKYGFMLLLAGSAIFSFGQTEYAAKVTVKSGKTLEELEAAKFTPVKEADLSHHLSNGNGKKPDKKADFTNYVGMKFVEIP